MSSVLLHVGLEKTGTKAIQYWLRDHPRLLDEYGLRFPRGWLRLNCHQELPLTLLRLDRMCSPRELGDEWLDVDWRIDVLEQLVDDLACHSGERTVLSSENLDIMRYDDEWEQLRAIVGDARILVYLRRPLDWIVSLRHQYLHKNGHGRALSADPDSYAYLEPDSWRLDFDALLDGWRRHFTHVDVLDYDEAVLRDDSVLPSFLRYLGLPVVDLMGYDLNQFGQPTPRAPGNREFGLRFGEAYEVQVGGKFFDSSMPKN